MENMESFRALGLSEDILSALQKKGFEEPTPIQAQCIPMLLKGDQDIVGQAQTGTGKTAAFGLPLLELIDERAKYISALILVPTRELAIQVAQEINSLRGSRQHQIIPIYGGQSIEEQFRRLRKGADIVVGTPGRILDHLSRKSIQLGYIEYVVLDEADEMLAMGFIEDVQEILRSTSEHKRTLLFSATMPPEILNIAKNYMNKYEVISVKKEQLTTSLTDQIYFEVSESDKFEALCRIVDMEEDFYGLIFCRTKIDVDEISGKLLDRGYAADGLHGDLSQYQREKILEKFKKQRINILVATDVAARGIDINNLTHVINYSLPQDPESYVHRIGRTGRAGKEGTAITFVTHSEYRRLMYIQKVARTDIRREKLPKVADVINMKKSRIIEDIEAIIQDHGISDFVDMAKELLYKNEPQAVLAALLMHAYGEELDSSNYSEIRETSIDTKGKARLFVAKGKMDGMTPKKLVEFIKANVKVSDRHIQDVQIFDKFSFINAPFQEAEMILRAFKNSGRGSKPLVTMAKAKK